MKKNIKAKVLAACLQKKEESIKNFENRINESRNDAYAQNHSASQSEDRTPAKLDLLSSYNNELAFALSEMTFLKSLDATVEQSIVQPGALVFTDDLNFFIGASEKIEVDGEEIYCISTNAPIYKMMEGMGKDDKFVFNEKEYYIENIY